MWIVSYTGMGCCHNSTKSIVYDKITKWRQRYWGESHMEIEVETRVIHLKSLECQGLLAFSSSLETSMEQIVGQSSSKYLSLRTPRFHLSHLQNCETRYVCDLQPPDLLQFVQAFLENWCMCTRFTEEAVIISNTRNRGSPLGAGDIWIGYRGVNRQKGISSGKERRIHNREKTTLSTTKRWSRGQYLETFVFFEQCWVTVEPQHGTREQNAVGKACCNIFLQQAGLFVKIKIQKGKDRKEKERTSVCVCLCLNMYLSPDGPFFILIYF